MSAITTHVLDTMTGRPAAGVHVTLDLVPDLTRGAKVIELATGVTDADGRLRTLLPDDAALEPGTYRLHFETRAYFEQHDVDAFYPDVVVTFVVKDASQHHHVPLLLSPFGYSTYRGS